MAEETDIVDQADTETQDEGPKPKPKPALPGLEKSGSKPPLPGLAPEKKNPSETTTGAGAVGGTVGGVPSSAQSNSTENTPDPLAGFQRRKGGDDAQLKKAQQQGGLLNLTPQQHFNAKLNAGNLTPDDLKNLKETDPEKYTELAKENFPASGDAFLKSETGAKMLSDNLNKKAKETNFIEAKDYDASYYQNLNKIIGEKAAPVNKIFSESGVPIQIKPTQDVEESKTQLKVLTDADRVNQQQIDKDKIVNWVERVQAGSHYQVNQPSVYDVTRMTDAEIEAKKSNPTLYNQLIAAKQKVAAGNQKAAAFHDAMLPIQNQFGTNLLNKQKAIRLPDPNKDGNDYVREIGEEIYKQTNPQKYALYKQAGGYDKSKPYSSQIFNSALDGVNKEIMTLGYNALRGDVAANGTDSQYANIYDNLKFLDYKFSTPKEQETKHRIAAGLKAKGINPSDATPEQKDEVVNTLPLDNQQVWYNKTKESGHTDLPNTGFMYSAGNSAQKTITNVAKSGSVLSPIAWSTLFLGTPDNKELAQEVLQGQMESDVIGENPESKHRYDELKAKQEKGSLTIPESYELKDLSSFTNTRSTWDKFKDGNGNMVGMIAGVTLDALPTLGAGLMSKATTGAVDLARGAEFANEVGTPTVQIVKGIDNIPLLEDAAAVPKTFAQKLGVPQDTKSLVDFAKNKNEMFVIMHHDNAKHAMELFPDDDTKKAWYTGITDVVSLALPNLLPTHKLGELFNSETKSAVATLVDKLNTDNIDKAVIDNLMKSTAKKIIEKSGTFLVGAEKSAAEAALTMSLMTLGNNVTQSVLDPESMKGGEIADNFLQTFTSTFMDSQLLGIIGGKGALQKKYGQIGVDAIYDATNSINSINSVKYTILDQQSKGQLTQPQVNEKISLLNTAADLRPVVDNLQKEEKLNPNQAKRVFVNLLNEAILKDQIRTLEKGEASELLIEPKQKRVDEINAINKKIVGKEVYVNDNYTVFTPEEKAQQDALSKEQPSSPSTALGKEVGSGVGGDVEKQYNEKKKSIEDKLNQQLEDNKDRLDDIEDKGGTKTVRQKIYQEHTNDMVELEKWKMREDLKNEKIKADKKSSEITENPDRENVGFASAKKDYKKANEIKDKIKSLRSADGSISEENLPEYKRLRKEYDALEEENNVDRNNRVATQPAKWAIDSFRDSNHTIGGLEEVDALKKSLKKDGYTDSEIDYIIGDIVGNKSDLGGKSVAKRFDEVNKNKAVEQSLPTQEVKAEQPTVSETPPALRDVESTAKALGEASKSKPTIWEQVKNFVKGAIKKAADKLEIVSNEQHISNFEKAKSEWDKLSNREKKLKRADYELDDLHHSEGGYYKVGNSLIDLDLNANHLKLLLENNKFLGVLNKLGITKIHGENRPAEEMFAHYSDGKIHLNNNSAFENIRQVTNAMSHELGHHEWTKLTKEERDYVRSLPLETGMAKHYEAQEKNGGKQTSASLQEENFADYVMQYFQGKLYGDEALLNKIPTKLREIFDNKYSDLLKDNEHTEVSEAYHKAKADGSNPELVKAVEDLIGKEKPQEVLEPSKAKSKLAAFKEKHKPESTELTPAENKEWDGLSMAEKLKLAKENLPEVEKLSDVEAAKVADKRAKELLSKKNETPEPENIVNEKTTENEQPRIADDRNENVLAAEKLLPKDNPVAESDVKDIEGKAENPGRIESKELYAADQAATKLINDATGVVNVPIADISTNEGEYQGRKNKFSERSAKNVAENYDPNKLDPIVLYKHPDGKTYVLSGHSRFEGMTRRGEKTIPARYFEGTPEEAKDFAQKSNKLGTLQTDIENAAYYRDKLKAGESYNSLLSEAKENEQEGTAKRIVSLAHLNPDGKAMQALDALDKGEGDTKNNILNIAQKIGDIRAKNEHLTDAHENELFDHMVADKKNIPTDKDIANQNNTLNRSINHAKFSPEEPLNLDKVVNKSDNRIQWEKEKKDLEQQQANLKKQVNPSKVTGWTGLKEKAIASLTNGDKTPEAIDKAVKDFESNKDGIKDAYQKQLEQKRAELNSVNDKLAKHLLREKDLIEGDKNQQSLFAVQGNTPEQVSDMKDIVKELVDEGNTNLADIQKIVAKELGNNSEEMKGLVEEAFHEYGKDAENTPKEITPKELSNLTLGEFASRAAKDILNADNENSKADTKSAEPVEAEKNPSNETESPENSEPAAEGETDENGVRISKAGLKMQSNFSKEFDRRGGQEVADGVMATLQRRADAKGISVQQQAAEEVAKMKGRSVEPTEHNIITAGTHLLDLDKQLKTAIANNDINAIEGITKLRDEANAVLRQLGNNAGRNLGLFNLVFADARDSELSVTRENLKRALGVEDVPETIEELKKSGLTSSDKKKVEPFVAKIEQLKKERDGYIDKDGNRVEGYEEKTMKNIAALEDADVQKAIQEAHEAGKKAGMAIAKDKPAREKKSQQLRDIASRLRTSDEMDKFLNRAGGFEIEKSGIDLGSYKEIIANILDGVADITEGAEKVGDFIKNAIDKVQGVDKDKLLRDVQTIISRASLPDKAETIADINKIAENENAKTITKTMVEKGLIKNVVDDVIHSDVPYDKVIETATEELKQHLPNVTKADVADAYVRRNEFAPEKKSALENTVRTKSEDVKRITVKEARLAALEAGEDYHVADTKEAKQKVRSDYEKSVDDKISQLTKEKSDAEKQLKEPKTHSDRLQEAKDAVQERIDKIRTEIADRERTVAKEKLPLHEDVELGRLKEVEKALTSLRDKYLPEQPKMFAEEKALKKRRVDLTNDISELNDQINKGERKEKNTSTVEDTEHIKTLREIKKAKQELLDKVAPDYDKLKRQADKEAADLKKRIDKIEEETKSVKESKKVFERAIVSPHTVSDLLKAAREERDKTYAENGLRVQKNGREPIRIEREYQKAVDETNNSNLLTDAEKQDKLAELKQQRDLDLQGTHQGVLSHLADDVDALKKENIEAANDADADTAQKLNDLNKKLDSVTEGLQPTGENLEDMATKAYGKLNDLLADKDVPKDVKEKLQQIKKDFENNNQLTSDQLANKAIKKQWEREIRTAQTKINSGNFTELPTTPFDFRRSIELSNLDRQRQNTTKQLNNLQVEAREKNKTMLDKIMDFSTKLLVSGAHTVLKVAEAGAFKPVMDTVVESTTGRVFSKLTNTPKTTLAEIKQATRQYYAFKNKAAAEAHIVKLQDAKLAALDNLDKAIKGGNEAEIKKAENEFKKADLTYGISTLYHSIDANSLKTFWEYVAHGATDLDEQVGKGLKKNISDYRTNLGKAGYVLDGWIRTHGAFKTSLSARNEIMRSYASTLKYMQDKGMELNEQNLALAHLIAVNDFEYGRLSNKTAFSTLISKGKTHKSQAVRVLTKTLAPVSTIAINITKRGIDYSTLGAEGWLKLANAVKEGNRINEVEGKVYDTWMQKYADGIKQIPLQERKYINGVISRGLFGAGLSLATLYGLSTGNIKYGGTYDDKNKRKVYGADGELLKPNEWEFWGWKAPKLVEHFINHLPEMLPLALTSDIYEINKLDKNPAYLKTVFSEVQNRMPFMTLLGLINRPAETLTDRFTRFPLATEVEQAIDPKERENKTIGQKLKNNFGLGFLNPEKGANGYDVAQDHFKALKELGINAPKSKEIDQYKIEEDAAHPTGKMTEEEGKIFEDERSKLVDEGLKNLYEKGIKLQRKDFGILRIDLQSSKEDIEKILSDNNITMADFEEQLTNKKKAIVSEATKKAKKIAVPNQTKANQMTSTIPTK